MRLKQFPYYRISDVALDARDVDDAPPDPSEYQLLQQLGEAKNMAIQSGHTEYGCIYCLHDHIGSDH